MNGAVPFHALGAGSMAESWFSIMSLIVLAGRRPSVLSAGLLLSIPINTIVGRPCICRRKLRSHKTVTVSAYNFSAQV